MVTDTFDNPSSNQETPGPFRSKYQKLSPTIGSKHFYMVLVLLCSLPVAIIAVIWQYLPPTESGKLQAKVQAAGLPEPDYYVIDYRERLPWTGGGELLVTNLSDEEWTHLTITINKNYQIMDTKSIHPGETVSFRLDRFVSRSGATFKLRYNELKSAMIYARRPSKKRATYYHEFDTVAEGTRK